MAKAPKPPKVAILCALDVHHVEPTKKNTRLRATREKGRTSLRDLSYADLETELSSCVLLCRNCHAAVEKGILTCPTAPSPTA